MSPGAQNLSRYREPFNEDGGYDSDSFPEQDLHRFPSKRVDETDEDAGFPQNVERQQHYADSEPKSRLTDRSHTSSSARRSRKTSSSTARDLVRVLLHERLEADASADVQLARAYEVLRAESRRAADAERIALESAERLKGLAISRSVAQKDAMRAQAELAAYRLQLENAQRQLEEANAIAAVSDAERVRAERSMGRLKRTVEKLRGGELERRAREQGWREGRREALGGLAGQMRSSPREPIFEEDDDEILHTPTSNVPIPVPPPESIAILPRRSATPTLRRSTRTPVPSQLDWHSGQIPDVRRQATPPSWRAPTPSFQLPVPPPASNPVLSRRSETPRPRHTAPVYNDFDPVPTMDPRDQQPDHIIVRSPVPRHGPFHPPPTTRPASSQATRPTHISYPRPQQPPDAHRGRTRHYSIDDPAAVASASAHRIYSHYATSSESSSSEPPRPPSRSMRSRHGLPEQETIIPRPARRHDDRFSPPVRPPSAFDSVPLSAAALARQRQLERRISHSSSSATSSPQTEKSFPAPSRVAQLARQSLGQRKWSAESGSSVPGIFIEPPSRPESIDSAGTAHPSHISPFGPPEPELSDDIPSPAWGMQSQPLPLHPSAQMTPHVPRPASRTGFMYGPPSPGSAAHPPPMGMGMGLAFGADGTGASAVDGMGFATPPSPGVNFGAPPPAMPPTPHRSAGPRHTHVSGMPTEFPGNVNDYFGGDHHRSTQASGHGRRHGHRREPAAMAASVENLGSGVVDPNAFHDPDTDPSLQDEEDGFRGGRAPTPRASAGAHTFDEGRAAFDERRGGGNVHGSERGSLGRRSGTPGPAFVPPRPSSRASVPYDEFGPAGGPGFDSPQRGPLPPSSGTSAYPSRVGSVGPAGNGGRSRKTSFLNGGTNGRRVEAGGSQPASRTAFGNTPYVRSSGLYEG